MTDVRPPSRLGISWHRVRGHEVIECQADFEPPWFRCDNCDVEWHDVDVAFAAARFRAEQRRLNDPYYYYRPNTSD